MKKSIKFAVIFAALLGFGTFASASPLENTSNVGITGLIGVDIGYGGLQYQHWFGDHGVTVEGFTYYLEDNAVSPFWYQLNAQYDYKLFETAVSEQTATRLSIYGALGNLGWTNRVGNTQQFYTNVFLSGGFIVDTMVFKHVSIPLKIGFSASIPNKMSAGICVGSSIRFSY